MAIRNIFRKPARYTEAYVINNKIDGIILKDANYEAKMKAIEKYFAKKVSK